MSDKDNRLLQDKLTGNRTLQSRLDEAEKENTNLRKARTESFYAELPKDLAFQHKLTAMDMCIKNQKDQISTLQAQLKAKTEAIEQAVDLLERDDCNEKNLDVSAIHILAQAQLKVKNKALNEAKREWYQKLVYVRCGQQKQIMLVICVEICKEGAHDVVSLTTVPAGTIYSKGRANIEVEHLSEKCETCNKHAECRVDCDIAQKALTPKDKEKEK